MCQNCLQGRFKLTYLNVSCTLSQREAYRYYLRNFERRMFHNLRVGLRNMSQSFLSSLSGVFARVMPKTLRRPNI